MVSTIDVSPQEIFPLLTSMYTLQCVTIIQSSHYRVSLCVEADPSLCGHATETNSAYDREAVPQLATSDNVSPDNWMVGVVVGVLFTLVATLVVMVKFCWCSTATRRDKMSAAAEREKQIILSRPDILHPIDEKMMELTMSDTYHPGHPGHSGHHRTCAHHTSGLYTNNLIQDGSHDSDDSVWWIKQQQLQHQQQQQQHDCGCECKFGGGGGMRDAQSLPHLSSPQTFRHVAPQYFSQVTNYFHTGCPNYYFLPKFNYSI